MLQTHRPDGLRPVPRRKGRERLGLAATSCPCFVTAAFRPRRSHRIGCYLRRSKCSGASQRSRTLVLSVLNPADRWLVDARCHAAFSTGGFVDFGSLQRGRVEVEAEVMSRQLRSVRRFGLSLLHARTQHKVVPHGAAYCNKVH